MRPYERPSINKISFHERAPAVPPMDEAMVADFNRRHDQLYCWTYAFPNCYFHRRRPEAVTAPPNLNKQLKNNLLDKIVWEWNQRENVL